MKYDVLIKGGEIVDPASGYTGQMDVAIKRDRIAAVARDIPAETAFQVVDASGQYVTPGLIDLHTHVYHRVTFWGINPDPIAARSGVTTWLDVGSAGAFNWLGLREYVIKAANTRIYALLNISTIGLTAATGELANLDYCDVDLCCKIIDQHRDLLLGVKARIDSGTTGRNGIEPLRRARLAADRCELPLMAHIGNGPPTLDEVLALLKPGDILTHCFTGGNMRQIDEHGALLESAKRAWEAGIIMDIGHGAGSFSFETAEALMQAGYKPDVISSDIHQISVHGPLFDMPTCLSKFLYLGMSFPDVIRAATSRPAEVIGIQHEVGALKPGMLADVALWTIDEGRFPLYDIHLNMRESRQLIRNTLTILGGRPMTLQLDDPPMPWIALTETQRALVEQGHTPEGFTK